MEQCGRSCFQTIAGLYAIPLRVTGSADLQVGYHHIIMVHRLGVSSKAPFPPFPRLRSRWIWLHQKEKSSQNCRS
jgi:hypothetical protein